MPFAALLDTLFASVLAVDAVYVPVAGTPKSVRAIRKSPDLAVDFGGTEIAAATTLIEVRASEVADPRSGDVIEMGAGGPQAEAFVIQGVPARRDPDRLVWTIDVRKA